LWECKKCRKTNEKDRKKTLVPETSNTSLSTPSERADIDLQSASGLGMGASRVAERLMSAVGLSVAVLFYFHPHIGWTVGRCLLFQGLTP